MGRALTQEALQECIKISLCTKSVEDAYLQAVQVLESTASMQQFTRAQTKCALMELLLTEQVISLDIVKHVIHSFQSEEHYHCYSNKEIKRDFLWDKEWGIPCMTFNIPTYDAAKNVFESQCYVAVLQPNLLQALECILPLKYEMMHAIKHFHVLLLNLMKHGSKVGNQLTDNVVSFVLKEVTEILFSKSVMMKKIALKPNTDGNRDKFGRLLTTIYNIDTYDDALDHFENKIHNLDKKIDELEGKMNDGHF